MTFKAKSAAALAATLFVGACATGPAPQARVQPRGVDGEWVSTDGVAISRFTAGAFETVATDTGNKLAEGSYVNLGGNTIQITVISLIRQTTTKVNCALATPSQLNCTSESGQQFSLVRRVSS